MSAAPHPLTNVSRGFAMHPPYQRDGRVSAGLTLKHVSANSDTLPLAYSESPIAPCRVITNIIGFLLGQLLTLNGTYAIQRVSLPRAA
jgi:hypothetical protein